MISNQPRTMTVTVKTALYPREPFADVTQWCKFTTDMGTCTGKLPFYPKSGMRLKLRGSFGEYHGQKQFQFTAVEHSAPEDGYGLLKYVGELAKGVGPKAVDWIWSQFGDKWSESIELMPPKYAIPLRVAYDTVSANSAYMDALRWMLANGGTPRIAELAVHKWKRQAIAAVEANPYILTELDGVGFKTADAIAEKRGIGKRDVRRAIAAVDYTLREQMTASGDSVISRDALYSALDGLDVTRDAAALALIRLAADNRIVYIGEDHLTSSAVVRHEGAIGQYIVEHTAERDFGYDVDDCEIKYTERQREAVRNALNRLGLSVINGGAGTGKTTIVKAIAKELTASYEKFSLCAFAGKAAARLREATGFPASTIHSMLGAMGEGAVTFKAGSLEGETIIIDEASMVPSALLYEVVKRSPKRLILIGDQAQLPPVGIGAPFHDIAELLPSLVTTLDKCHRASGAVLKSGEAIRNGECPFDSAAGGESFKVIVRKDATAIHDEILEEVRDGNIDFNEDIIIIPRNGEGEDPMPCTVKSLNADIQRIVNPHASGEQFRVGDRVMCVKNYPKDDIWNGTCGWIRRVDTDGFPYFESDETHEETRLTKDQWKNIVPAWAVTIHKSQGSQYRRVHCVCLKRDAARIFDRSMLYTAVTRAKQDCVVYADDGLNRAVNAVHRRNTYLTKLIKEEI